MLSPIVCVMKTMEMLKNPTSKHVYQHYLPCPLLSFSFPSPLIKYYGQVIKVISSCPTEREGQHPHCHHSVCAKTVLHMRIVFLTYTSLMWGSYQHQEKGLFGQVSDTSTPEFQVSVPRVKV